MKRIIGDEVCSPGRRTTEKRHWHDATDPHQKARIEAAASKSVRKAKALHINAIQSRMGNYAHKLRFRVPGGTYSLFTPNRLDILHVTK